MEVVYTPAPAGNRGNVYSGRATPVYTHLRASRQRGDCKQVAVIGSIDRAAPLVAGEGGRANLAAQNAPMRQRELNPALLAAGRARCSSALGFHFLARLRLGSRYPLPSQTGRLSCPSTIERQAASLMRVFRGFQEPSSERCVGLSSCCSTTKWQYREWDRREAVVFQNCHHQYPRPFTIARTPRLNLVAQADA